MLEVTIPNWEIVSGNSLQNAKDNPISTDALNKFLSTVKVVTAYSLQYLFRENKNLTGQLFFPNLEKIEAYGLRSAFSLCENLSGEITFPKLHRVENSGLYNAFASWELGYDTETDNKITSFNFPELVYIGSEGLCYFAHYSTNTSTSTLTSVSFPKLETIDTRGMQDAFSRAYALNSISFPKLKSVGAYGLSNAFYSANLASSKLEFPELTTLSGDHACSLNLANNITQVKFPKLSSVVSGSLKNLFSSKSSNTIAEIHFPSSLQGNSECTLTNLGGGKTVYFDL